MGEAVTAQDARLAHLERERVAAAQAYRWCAPGEREAARLAYINATQAWIAAQAGWSSAAGPTMPVGRREG